MVTAMYFSGTDTTKTVVTTLAKTLAAALGTTYHERSFTLPAERAEPAVFEAADIVVWGTPVIAGRVPNVLLPYLKTPVGNGAIAIPVVCYGNRNFDDALIELRDLLINAGFRIAAAGAFIGEHSFSEILGAHRPDEQDLQIVRQFAAEIAAKLSTDWETEDVLFVEGTPFPYRPYYTPRDSKGNGIDIRKVKPKTSDACIDCKLCAKICPMGSIRLDNVREFDGICIKCCACVKKCPTHAKYYEDEGYLYHQQELEEMYAGRRAEPVTFL